MDSLVVIAYCYLRVNYPCHGNHFNGYFLYLIKDIIRVYFDVCFGNIVDVWILINPHLLAFFQIVIRNLRYLFFGRFVNLEIGQWLNGTVLGGGPDSGIEFVKLGIQFLEVINDLDQQNGLLVSWH